MVKHSLHTIHAYTVYMYINLYTVYFLFCKKTMYNKVICKRLMVYEKRERKSCLIVIEIMKFL